jgi:hypothetical protein
LILVGNLIRNPDDDSFDRCTTRSFILPATVSPPAMSGNQSCSRAIMPGLLHLSHRLTCEYLEQIFSARLGRLSGGQGGFPLNFEGLSRRFHYASAGSHAIP